MSLITVTHEGTLNIWQLDFSVPVLCLNGMPAWIPLNSKTLLGNHIITKATCRIRDKNFFIYIKK